MVQWLRIYLPCRAGDAGPIPVGRTKVPHATRQLSPHTAAREPARSRPHAPQLEKPVCHNQKQKACTPKWTALSINKETKFEDNVIWSNLEWQMWTCYGRWYLAGWNYHLCWILSTSPCRYTPSLFCCSVPSEAGFYQLDQRTPSGAELAALGLLEEL